MTELENESRVQSAAGVFDAQPAPGLRAQADVTLSAGATAILRGQGPARCSGTLADLAVADVLQLLQLIGKSAVMTVAVEHGGTQSRLWCSEGSLIDAESGRLRGEAAAYRILALDDGWLDAELRHEQRPRTIEAPTQRLLLEAARRKDETLGLKRKLGDERCCYRLVHEPEAEQLASLNAGEMRLLRVLASAPSVAELLADSDLGDLETLVLLERWSDAGYLAQVGPRPEPPAGHSAGTHAALVATDSAPSSGLQHVPSARPLTAGVSPGSILRTTVPPSVHRAVHSSVRSPSWSAAAAGAALLALVSFGGGYLLRGSTGVLPASTSAPQSTTQRLGTRPLDEPPLDEPPLDERQSDAPIRTAEATRKEQADTASPAAPSSDGALAVASPSPSASVLEASRAARESFADSVAGSSAGIGAAPAPSSATGLSDGSELSARATKTRHNPPAEEGRGTTGPLPKLSEPRVRVIGATEPSVRLLD